MTASSHLLSTFSSVFGFEAELLCEIESCWYPKLKADG
jgi:hypothetical protein